MPQVEQVCKEIEYRLSHYQQLRRPPEQLYVMETDRFGTSGVTATLYELDELLAGWKDQSDPELEVFDDIHFHETAFGELRLHFSNFPGDYELVGYTAERWLQDRIKERIEAEGLEAYSNWLLSDWEEGLRHLMWAATAPKAEIEEWLSDLHTTITEF